MEDNALQYPIIDENLQYKWITEWQTSTRYHRYYKTHYNFISARFQREGAKYLCEYWDEKNETDTEVYVFNAITKRRKKRPIAQQLFKCNNGHSYYLDLCYPFEMFHQRFYVDIEIDGNDHNRTKDENRDAVLLKEHNVYTIRISNKEIYKSINKEGLDLTGIIDRIDLFILNIINLYFLPTQKHIH